VSLTAEKGQSFWIRPENKCKIQDEVMIKGSCLDTVNNPVFFYRT